MLTNEVVSFEQPGPGTYPTKPQISYVLAVKANEYTAMFVQYF